MKDPSTQKIPTGRRGNRHTCCYASACVCEILLIGVLIWMSLDCGKSYGQKAVLSVSSHSL